MGPQARVRADSPSVLRRINSALILEVIRARGPLSRTEIARATGLSKPTVNDVVGLLLEATYVRQSLAPDGDGGRRPRRPGPRARLMTFRADLGHVLGLDIGADKALAVVADLSGRILARERRPISHKARAGQRVLLHELEGAGEAALATAGVDPASLRAVGVGTPGVVDPSTGRIALAPQLEGWEGLELGRELGSAFGCPAFVDNETNLSLLGERWQGAAVGVRNALYVQVGVGIGGAILIDGEVYRGMSGAAGEIGYLLGEEDPEPPQLGSGPFEWAAGARAYVRLGARAAAGPAGALLLELAGGEPERVTAELVFAAAAQGCPASRDIVDLLAGRLGRGIANATTVLNPEMVILGGGVSNAGAALRAPVERAVREHAPAPPAVVLSALGDESVAFGAVRFAMDKADERIFAFSATGNGEEGALTP
jgi:predicted NBD/HSP70 family sugar kinase